MCVNVYRPMRALGTLTLAAVMPHGLAVTCLVLAALPGCGRAPERFQVNRVFARNQKLAESAADFAAPNVSRRMGDIERVVTQFFGTPSEPTVPELEGVALDSLFQLPNLQMAAGSVRRAADGTAHGLYRNYCVQCHGLTGDGGGSSARGLDPYPRDYRRGIFKYKRTPSTLPPTGRGSPRCVGSRRARNGDALVSPTAGVREDRAGAVRAVPEYPRPVRTRGDDRSGGGT